VTSLALDVMDSTHTAVFHVAFDDPATTKYVWNGTTTGGGAVPAGTYYARATADNGTDPSLGDMELVEAFRTQAAACGRLGSSMYAELLERIAADLESGGAATSAVLLGHEHDPGPSALALRLAGSVHRLVLAGEAPALAAYFPSVGGAWDLEAAWPVFLVVLVERRDDVRRLLELAPQTNEVGRAAALLGGLLRIGSNLPVRLFEIGASGGLNLRADAFRYVDDAGRSWGSVDSPVVLEGAWSGVPLDLAQEVAIVERAGCDVSPVDALTADGRLTLSAYVWPDQPARHARLRGAFDLAARIPAVVEAVDAATFVEGLELREGHLTVLWHSVMWQYVPTDQQESITAHLRELGSRASSAAPLAHLYAEPVRRTPESKHEFLVCVERWPGGGDREILGELAPHGLPSTWEV